MIVSLTWAPARNPFSINTTPWFQWDSGNCLRSLSHGITFGRCGGPGFTQSSIERWLNVRWCGTAGWLPGYSWLVSALHLLGFSLPLAGLLLSWVAMAAAMFLIWFGWAHDLPPIRSFLLLMLFGLFPGAVYSFAIFPLSIALLCIMGSVFRATGERFFVAALFMVFGGLCYPSAWFAAAGLAIGLVLVAIPFGRSTMVRRGLWGVAGLASLPILGLLDWSTVGTALAYFKSQSNYNSGAPGMYFFRLLFTTKTRQQQAIGRFYGEVLAFQALLAAVITGYAACSTSLAWRRGQRAPLQIYPAVVGASVAIGLCSARKRCCFELKHRARCALHCLSSQNAHALARRRHRGSWGYNSSNLATVLLGPSVLVPQRLQQEQATAPAFRIAQDRVQPVTWFIASRAGTGRYSRPSSGLAQRRTTIVGLSASQHSHV